MKAEYSIKRSRGKKVKVQAGWYSEEAMRSDLKLSQFLVLICLLIT